MINELKYAMRQLAQSPGFAMISILTLALGIGANIAVFSVTNAMLLNPSGIPHAANWWRCARSTALADLQQHLASPLPISATPRTATTSSRSAAVMHANSLNYSRDNANPELLHGAQVSSGVLRRVRGASCSWAGVHPRRRSARREHEAVSLLSRLAKTIWRRSQDHRPHLLSQPAVYRVIGVMGPDFKWPNQVELWIPIALPPARYHDHDYRYNENMFGVARLQPGVSLKQANAYLEHEGQQEYRLRGQELRAGRGWGMFALPLTEIHRRQPAASRSPCC